ncbi:hypothetical protein PSENEW3n2_00003733 [Picochlorum sp. SENEW3]|nr:hypothetical protein PSENEW3n2_00003733 [Picochlorum sp. SENEW3]WPT18433.1 hypothetical protein PSENEW3_00003733 [Picochlorum sp. SENEW3]
MATDGVTKEDGNQAGAVGEGPGGSGEGSVLHELNAGLVDGAGGVTGAKKRVLATTTATAVTTMSKRRMSIKNRRVSFAPDTELTMIRTFEKDDGMTPPGVATGGVLELKREAEPVGEDPMIISPPPMGADYTNKVGDITAGLPSLGDLAEEEEQYHAHAHDNVTAAVPGLATLLEEDAMMDDCLKENKEDVMPSPPVQTSPDARKSVEGAEQENKWGFMPGDDDTLDVDLKGHGRMFMGDKTYSKMYADNVTATSLASVEKSISLDGEVRGPEMGAGEHPALLQSPNYTDSSIGTVSTRRVSVDGRRMSVSSRRMSMAGNVHLKNVGGMNNTAVVDDEEDLLAESPGSMKAKSFDVLAGLKNRLSSVTKPSPRRKSLPLVPEDMEMPESSFHSPAGSGAHIMYKSPPPSATFGRQRTSFYSNRDSIPGKGTPGSVSKSGMRTPVRANALIPVNNPPNSTSQAPPGSAIAARYPGSAVATGRLSQGFTPSRLAPITFQDFAKIVEVQFLDNLRRGASINYADLQPNPIPSNLKESYSLLCITAPNVAELETAINTLQSEITRLRSSASDLEVMLGQTNPAIFRHVQTASYEQLEALRGNVASLKKACRAKATALLKDVRCQMEESKHGRLCRAHDGLKSDLAWLQEVQRHAKGISNAASAFAAEKREYMARRRREIAAQMELKQRLLAARKAAEDRIRANQEREQQLMVIESSANNLDAEINQIKAEKVEVDAQINHMQRVLKQASLASVHDDATAKDIHQKFRDVTLYEKCSGLQIYSCFIGAKDLTCTLNVADVFLVDLVSAGSCPVTVTVKPMANNRQRCHQLAMKFVSKEDVCSFSCEPPALVCLMQTLVPQLQLAATAAKELHGIRSSCHNICEITPIPMDGSSEMAVKVSFLALEARVQFSVILAIKDMACLNIETIFGAVDEDRIRSAIRTHSDLRGIAGVCASLSTHIAALNAPKEHGNVMPAMNQNPAPEIPAM